MAEAIAMERDARGLEPVRRDGTSLFCVEEVMAAHCAIEARDAFIAARTLFFGTLEA